MGKIVLDLSQIEDAEDFSPIPDGEYLCVLDEVEETTTRESADDMWKLKWKVAEGPCENRVIFDQIIFSERGLKRVKLVLRRIGLDVSGRLELSPEMIQGAVAYVTVHTEEYRKSDGSTARANRVDFAGYRSADSGEIAGQGTPIAPALAAPVTPPTYPKLSPQPQAPARAPASPPATGVQRQLPPKRGSAPPAPPATPKLPF